MNTCICNMISGDIKKNKAVWSEGEVVLLFEVIALMGRASLMSFHMSRDPHEARGMGERDVWRRDSGWVCRPWGWATALSQEWLGRQCDSSEGRSGECRSWCWRGNEVWMMQTCSLARTLGVSQCNRKPLEVVGRGVTCPGLYFMRIFLTVLWKIDRRGQGWKQGVEWKLL